MKGLLSCSKFQTIPSAPKGLSRKAINYYPSPHSNLTQFLLFIFLFLVLNIRRYLIPIFQHSILGPRPPNFPYWILGLPKGQLGVGVFNLLFPFGSFPFPFFFFLFVGPLLVLGKFSYTLWGGNIR